MIRLLLYKCQLNDGHHFDDIIYGFQKWKKDPHPELIHVELGFDDGVMFSSSGRGGFLGEGTRFTDSTAIDLDKWDIHIIQCSKAEEEAVRASCRRLVGKRYDWLGIIGMAAPVALQAPWAFFCSEVCNHVLAEAGLVKASKRIRPSQMLDSYIEQGLITL